MKHWVVLLSVGLLSGCATLPRMLGIGDAAAGDAAQRARAAALGLERADCGAPGWAMTGRVALSNGRDGGSAKIEWAQGGGHLRMLLSAPLTRQSWILEADPASASLQGLAHGVESGRDPAQLLRRATGWDIPVNALGCWLRAVAGDTGRFGPAWIEYDGDLLPRRLEQDGWVVDYLAWSQDPFTGLPMPARIHAQRGNDRVRLVIDRWGLE